ncbi:hypothetical protein E2320_022621, partial [Naja naja]
ECHLMKYEYPDRVPNGLNLTFAIVETAYEGEYTCMASEQLFLHCEVTFTFLKDSPQEVWWAIDGRHSDDVTDFKFNISTTRPGLDSEAGEVLADVPSKVMRDSWLRNQLWEWIPTPVLRYTVELACGLGATVLLVVLLTVIYHFYWLEMVLFYRAHFGTDETVLDGKEYDIYVSYARNTEEEDFVLLTLRGVLENEYGYKLCIFDRDSLPGGSEYPPNPSPPAALLGCLPLPL